MTLKNFIYSCFPDSLAAELRHMKHVRDLANAVEPEEPAIRPLIKSGQVVLDIGANFGVFTKLFSNLVGPAGSVVAFEPVPQTFRTLKAGMERLKLSNVQVHNKAVSNRVGSALMEVPRYSNNKGDNLYEAHLVSASHNDSAFPVEVVTVDSLALSRVDFIKIDVEGHELEVLEGSKSTLMQYRPMLMVEVTSLQTVWFLRDTFGYQEPRVLSPSNQLFIHANSIMAN